MSSHDTRGRSPNDGRRLQSQSSQRSGYGGRFPSPGSESGTFRTRSSDSVGLEGSATGSRPISGQRKRPRAMELLVSAQEQLKALSKLTLNPKNSRQPQRRQQIPSRSSSSSSRTPQDILPDKKKFECLQQMSQLLSQSHAESKHIHSSPVMKTPSTPKSKPSTPNEKSLECKFQETSLNLKEMLRMSETQMKNYSALPTRPSRPETRSLPAASKPKERGSPTEASKSRELGDLQFEYIHNILRKSNALTKNDRLSRTPGGVNSRPHTSDTPKPQSSHANKESNYFQEIADIVKLNKGQDRNTGKPMTPKIQAKPQSSELRRTATRDMNSKVFQNKVTENLLKSGKAPGETDPVKDTNNSPKEAVVQTMEQEVKSLQKELELVQAERRGLALQKKLLNCMADVPAGGPAGGPSSASRALNDKPLATPNPNKPLILLQKSHAPENLSAVELQLNSLREQYRKLQEDYNIKVEEVSMVRVEYEAAKRDALALLEKSREAEARVDDLLERLRIIELEKTKMAGSKDQMMELEQQLTLAKQRYREGQEELEELKTTMQDQMLQLEEYRNKYLSAQQTVEEQRRQIDIMELENNRISEQVNLEIQRVKTQFQEKLQELTPLPDMLKATQLKLQECDQLRQLAERNVEQLLNQSDDLKEQNKKLETELEELKKNSATHNAERSNLTSSLSTGEKKIEEIKSENSKLRATVARLEEVALNNDRRLDEKNHEVLQLQSQLETLREESARQVSRTKDRCEAVRRTLQNQIAQLECQLAQSRAAARTAQKDRDEIRQRMQAQITSLNDNFEQAQLRIRSLQSHVNYLKSSYTNIFAPDHTIGPKPIDGWSS